DAAKQAIAEWKAALQQAEWARLLEQAEDELPVVIAEQNAAAPGSSERDKLDALATDVYAMVRILRKMVGADPGAAGTSRTRIAAIRAELAAKEAAAAQWRFSGPALVRQLMERPENAVFVMQGDGTLHVCDKSATQRQTRSFTRTAEL